MLDSSALALELKNELRNGMVGAALRAVALEIGKGILVMDRGETDVMKGVVVRMRRKRVRCWKRIGVDYNYGLWISEKIRSRILLRFTRRSLSNAWVKARLVSDYRRIAVSPICLYVLRHHAENHRRKKAYRRKCVYFVKQVNSYVR
jgi:hypothetical protein